MVLAIIITYLYVYLGTATTPQLDISGRSVGPKA